jgi:hypothetical protein
MTLLDYPGHFVAFLAVVVMVAATIAAFRTSQLQTTGRRIARPVLMALQIAVVLSLVGILCDPSRERSTAIYGSNAVLTVFDTSKSMSITEDGQQTRLDRALGCFTECLRSDEPRGLQYKVYGFDAHLYHCGSPSLLRRWGTQTNLHNALSELMDFASQASNPESAGRDAKSTIGLAGVVIFTDGQSLDKNPQSYPVLAGDGLPVVFVGVGSRKPSGDISVASISAPARVWVDSAYTLTSEITNTRPSNNPITLELLCDGQLAETRLIGPGQFTTTTDGHAQASVEFTIPVSQLGTQLLTVRAKPHRDETTTANNSRSVTVEATEQEPLSVLLYSQWAGFDIGKIRQTLVWNKQIHLDFGFDVVKDPSLSEQFRQSGGYVKLPRDREEYSRYDVIILGPCDLSQMSPDQLDGLYRFVTERGGGLLFLPGPAVTSLASWHDDKGSALLPVILNEQEARLWPPRPDEIEVTFEAAALHLFDPDTFEQQGELLSPYYNVATVKPAALTLAAIGDAPLIAMHRLGRGRVCLLNAGKLFRLYREDQQGGALTDMLSGLLAQLGRTTAQGPGIDLFVERATDNSRRAVFNAHILDEDFRAVDTANVLLSVSDDVVAMKPLGHGHYGAELDLNDAQSVVATVQAECAGVFLGRRVVAVNLPPVQDEMSDVRLDEGFLRALAAQTGARYVHIDDFDKRVAGMFVAGRQVGTTRAIRSAWPTWPLLAILCLLLTVKWFLRRAVGLV